jgi:hypothetical protein
MWLGASREPTWLHEGICNSVKGAVVFSENVTPSSSRHLHPVRGAVVAAAGYGIMFFWQLGVLQYLEQNFDLSRCAFVGSSAGSMLSVLAACDVGGQVRI